MVPSSSECIHCPFSRAIAENLFFIRVKVLSDPAHRFKVRKNAEQLNLTGVCIFHPSFNMVYVEGASKFIRNYKRLMLHRIAWTEAARARGAEEVEIDDDDESGSRENEQFHSCHWGGWSSRGGVIGEQPMRFGVGGSAEGEGV
jgi:hypothetical protein